MLGDELLYEAWQIIQDADGQSLEWYDRVTRWQAKFLELVEPANDETEVAHERL